MSGSPSPTRRPLRTAGTALLGIAAITGLIWLVGSLSGNAADSDVAAAPSRSTAAPPPSSPARSPAPTSTPTASHSATKPATPEPSPSPDPDERAALRVLNNSLITGLAARAASDFRSAGWTVVEVGNYARSIIPASTIYYRPGTDQREDAKVLAERFSMRVQPRFPGIEYAGSGLVVILAKDYPAHRPGT